MLVKWGPGRRPSKWFIVERWLHTGVTRYNEQWDIWKLINRASLHTFASDRCRLVGGLCYLGRKISKRFSMLGFGGIALSTPTDSCDLFHDDVIKWKHLPRYWPFVRGIHRSPVNSPYQGQWRGALMFSLISTWPNGWVNTWDADDLRRHCAHYDVIVMYPYSSGCLSVTGWFTGVTAVFC